MPTRKWWAATIVSTSGWAIAFINAGFTHTVQIGLVTLVSSRLVAYVVKNDTSA